MPSEENYHGVSKHAEEKKLVNNATEVDKWCCIFSKMCLRFHIS